MQTPDRLNDGQLSDEQSREVAEMIREEIARRRISRQALAEQAKLSLSTLEKALGGRRPFTLATTVRLEQALGVSLRKNIAVVTPPAANDVAPDSLGSYSHRAVTWLEDVYITLRPSFGDKDAIFAYRTEIVWEPQVSSLVFREGERTDAAYEHTGEVAVPHQSGFIYLVINKHGQHRVITVSRPTVGGVMYGIISTLRAGPGSQLTPVAAPIAYVPLRNIPKPSLGRVGPDDTNHAFYRDHLRRTVDESFALFLPG
ncbi:helix-turn-helix transcriptional regulator [Bradyrhizobium diazoefficiens]|uniref:helix-turn-helix domain-containing protein n=1 Tax=Bradyrhizobium diazoefficiens TaxID=1355477 RepID=UPI00190BB305|nr:helix-turn-helix transcriptional regulator [Bradyrhizobium diazoefficiens]MBK3661390.1 helix-turn-helix transcriptional regulator [Bradyrhizobium diazoefficiens]